MDKKIKNRFFSDRGFLEFVFYKNESISSPLRDLSSNQKSSDNIPAFKVKIPFYENPIIQEKKQARLGTYKPIGRNSDLYSFLGANSKSINLSFNLTLLNLKNYLESYSLDYFIVKNSSKEQEKKKFTASNNSEDNYSGIFDSIQKYVRNFHDLDNSQVVSTEFDSVRVLYYFWTNIIRCSVVGTTDHRSSPPIIKLSFGPLFKRVPFIAKSYGINIDDKSGYDLETLLPKQVKITLDLEEIRVGDFGKYSAYDYSNGSSIQKGENVAGWEYILETGSLDPLIGPGEN